MQRRTFCIYASAHLFFVVVVVQNIYLMMISCQTQYKKNEEKVYPMSEDK